MAGRGSGRHGREGSKSERLEKRTLQIGRLLRSIMDGEIVVQPIRNVNHVLADVILCSHVLEHVEDDRKAMRELFRVLRPGGWAMIQVPLSSQPTFEDPSITDPAERERLFWQADHVRLYGLDIADRLREAGFNVVTVFGEDLVDPDQLVKTGIYPRDAVFLCRKAKP